ncbi:MAG: branched-chain amino acid transport system substrate-binding protein [Acidimicrobiaceae bacterium]|jgi:ABC-type branched-subunit amino acid transport system substrate-binding protein|nr:branched-chain amino acid transport system substrate-binding protein [Acidimicrobiaceae bacterium]
MRRAALASVLAGALVLAACGRGNDQGGGSGRTAVVVVNAPFSKVPSVAKPIEQGARLAAEELNKAGGVDVAGVKVRLDVRLADDQGSPTISAANIRKAASDGAVAVVAEGTGVDVAWEDAGRAGLPIGIVYQGGEDLIDVAGRRNVFRIAPTNRGVAFRLAEYVIPKGGRIALLHDDSPYGAGGKAALDKAFARNRSAVAADLQLSSAPGADPGPQVVQARSAGATAVVVWAGPQVLASVVRAARSTGWPVPFFAATSGEDALVRQQLSAHPEWLDGLTFVSSRLTSEKGPAPFEKYRSAFEKRFGPQRVGVKSGGKDVVSPPDWAMYAYDFVKVVADAMHRSQADRAAPGLVRAMEETEVQGANGDERGFNKKNHEGVVDDDVFFAVFKDMVWTPVRDDPLSASLPPIPQTL